MFPRIRSIWTLLTQDNFVIVSKKFSFVNVDDTVLEGYITKITEVRKEMQNYSKVQKNNRG